MTAPPRALRQLDCFLDMLAAERGAAKNTQEAYRRDLTDYIDYLARAQKEPARASTDSLRDYLSALQTRGMSSATLARRVSALRQFHKFLYVDRHRADDPAAALEGPRRVRNAPGVLSIAEVDGLLRVSREGLDDETRPLGERMRAARMYALLETLYATGLRVSELVSLPKSAARARDPFIAIKGKGGRERIVPLTTHAKKAISAYRALLEAKSPALAASPFLFPSDGDSGHLTRQAFARDLENGGGRGGDSRERYSSACSAPRLRQPFAAKRRRSARRAGTARPRRYFDDADLHSCARRADARDGARSASAFGRSGFLKAYATRRMNSTTRLIVGASKSKGAWPCPATIYCSMRGRAPRHSGEDFGRQEIGVFAAQR